MQGRRESFQGDAIHILHLQLALLFVSWLFQRTAHLLTFLPCSLHEDCDCTPSSNTFMGVEWGRNQADLPPSGDLGLVQAQTMTGPIRTEHHVTSLIHNSQVKSLMSQTISCSYAASGCVRVHFWSCSTNVFCSKFITLIIFFLILALLLVKPLALEPKHYINKLLENCRDIRDNDRAYW